MPIHDPKTVAELQAALRVVHEESITYWKGFPDEEFFAPMGAHWSAADHVRHLTRSMRPVAQALRLPRWVLLLMFGQPPARSRTFDQLRTDYLAVLAAGGTAGKYAPEPLPGRRRTPRERARVMRFHAEAVGSLADVVGSWRDDALDGACLPHPLLGKLTLREMIEFMVYHNLHHVQVAERRRAEARQSA